MNIQEKLSKVFSPLDVVTLEKEFQVIVSKDENLNVPKECLDFAAKILSVGEFPARNPTCWKVFQDDPVEIGSESWKDGISKLFLLENQHEISELDVNSNHLKIVLKFELLAINTKELHDAVFKGVKCAYVKTAFGSFQVTHQKIETIE